MRITSLLIALTVFGASYAASAAEPVKASTASPATEAAVLSDGEVRKIDKDTKKITIKHGELKNLDMPAMTMVFQVKDPALLDKAKVGDKIKFKAEKVTGGFAATEIEVAK
jgi:Cu/Ag efflux protein CusF